MTSINNYRLLLNQKEYVPIIIGGMGVDISTPELAYAATKLGGIGHISDALLDTVTERHLNTKCIKNRAQKYRHLSNNTNKNEIQFDLTELYDITKKYITNVMEAKPGNGAIFVNCMEKLIMNNSKPTLKTRLTAAMDAGIDGITLAAGLHLSSFELIKDHPRFHDVQLGIIVSSVRALKLFLIRAKKNGRYPDYIIVEGPLAGGHLGFGEDWQNYNLKTIVNEVLTFLKQEDLNIPVIPAGGIFTGTDGVDFLKMGAKAIQVATRFTVTKESGLPTQTKQNYFNSYENDVLVCPVSPTGYLIRILKQSPALVLYNRPQCEKYGYLLENGDCSYLKEYENFQNQIGPKLNDEERKICLCTHMAKFNCWVCGHNVYRLKDTTNQLPNGEYQILDAEHVFLDYQHSIDHQITLPSIEK